MFTTNWRRGALWKSSAPPTGVSRNITPPTGTSSAVTNVRGSSSADFPKKSYTLKLDDTLGHSTALGPYGLTAFDAWDLVGPWKYDPTCLHNVFTYALSNRLGRWAARTQLVEVFLHTGGGVLDYKDYAGIYVFTDALKVDSKRVDMASLSPTDLGSTKITGGYFFKF